MKFHASVWLAAGLLAAGLSPAFAQAYPSRPVHLVVPFAPGGFTDVVARILQKELGASIGQPIIVENKPGAGSTIGTSEVAKAKPDGYTLVMISTTHVITPHLYKEMPYDPIRDFTPVMKLGEGPYVLVTHPSLPVKNVAAALSFRNFTSSCRVCLVGYFSSVTCGGNPQISMPS